MKKFALAIALFTLVLAIALFTLASIKEDNDDFVVILTPENYEEFIGCDAYRGNEYGEIRLDEDGRAIFVPNEIIDVSPYGTTLIKNFDFEYRVYLK